MCQKRSTTRVQVKDKTVRVDACMKRVIGAVNRIPGVNTLACCCGHDRYPMSIVIQYEDTGERRELFSNTFIPRTRNFYRTDKDGFYFIPECLKYD